MATTVAQLQVVISANAQAAEDGLNTINEKADEAGAKLKAAGEEGGAGIGAIGGAAEEGGGKMQEFLGKVGGIAAGIGAVELAAQGFDFLKEQITEMVHAGESANQVDAQIAAGLRSTHDASGMTSQGIDDLASKIMHMTGIDDDSVKSAEAMLLTFTNIGKDVFPQATQAVADLATKMAGGAVPSAMQMQQASIQLGKALGDPLKGYTALQRVGVTFSEQQKEQIKNFMKAGDVAGAQNVILKEMNKEFGGSAAAAGQANGGMAIFQATLENTKQTIGQAIIPVLTGMLGALTPIATAAAGFIPQALDFLKSHADEAKIVFAALGIAVATVVVPALLALLAPLAAVAGSILIAAAPVVLLGAALAGLALLFKHAYDTSEPFRKAVNTLVEQVKGLASIILGNLSDAFQRILPYLQQAGAWIGQHLQQAFQAILPHITDFINLLSRGAAILATNVEPAVTAATNVLIGLFQWISGTALPVVKEFADWLGTHLGPVIAQIGAWVQSTALPALKQFGQWLQTTALPAVKQFADTLGKTLGPIIQQVGAWVSGTLLPTLKQFGAWLTANALPAVKGVASAIGQFAADLSTRLGPALHNIGTVIGVVAGFLGNVLRPIAVVVFGAIGVALMILKTLWDAAWPAIQQVLEGVWNVIQGVVQVAWSIISGIIKVGLDLLGGNWKQAWTDIQQMFAGVWSGIQKILSGVLQATIGALFAWVGGILGKIGELKDSFIGHLIALKTLAIAKFVELRVEVEAKITELKNNVIGVITGLPGQFASIGQNIITSLVNALNPNTFINKLKDMASNALNAVKGVFGIHSPSKAFADIGQNMSLGLINGVKSLDVAGAVAAHLGKSLQAVQATLGVSVSGSASGSASGGILSTSSGIAALSAPLATSAALAAASGGGALGSAQPVHIHVHVAGRDVAHAVLPDIVQAIRRGTGIRTA